MKYDLSKMATFGVAGNFTGHLEQAGEAVDFANVTVKEANAPKAIFPTFIPLGAACGDCASGGAVTCVIPAFLHTYPFDFDKIVFPEGEEKLQIEPECALVFDAEWKDGKLVSLKPLCFGASNDCSIRKQGAKKISQKKNWGPSSKGYASSFIECNAFSEKGNINDYRIASFLVRGDEAFDYGEDSRIRDYSYVYQKLIDWMLDKFNNQKDEGPAENLNAYLSEAGFPEKIMVSIGATRYTEYGESNFLAKGDRAVVMLYPESKYSHEDIRILSLEKDIYKIPTDISFLSQVVV